MIGQPPNWRNTMALFLFRNTSASYFRPGLNLAWIRPIVVVVVIVLAATALGCGGEPETAETASSTPSSGAGSSASERSRATPAPSPVSTPASVAARESTEAVNTNPARQANNIQTQPAAPTDTVRPPTSMPTPTPTPTPSPEPTATVAVHTQTGGSVIMQAPTSTPTPPPDPTPTPTPVPGPYWERFTQAEYDQFLPPREPSNGQDKECARYSGR